MEKSLGLFCNISTVKFWIHDYAHYITGNSGRNGTLAATAFADNISLA